LDDIAGQGKLEYGHARLLDLRKTLTH
jgi:hypothetical protein